MSDSIVFLLGVMLFLGLTVLVLSLAIVALRWLRKLLLAAALVAGMLLGGAVISKHKDLLPSLDFPQIHEFFPPGMLQAPRPDRVEPWEPIEFSNASAVTVPGQPGFRE